MHLDCRGPLNLPKKKCFICVLNLPMFDCNYIYYSYFQGVWNMKSVKTSSSASIVIIVIKMHHEKMY